MTPATPSTPGGSSESARVEHEYDAETPPSIAIVQAIAALEDVDPTGSPGALGVRLYDHVDTEALDRLATDGGVAEVTIDLAIHGDRYAVHIHENGRLVVRKPR